MFNLGLYFHLLADPVVTFICVRNILVSHFTCLDNCAIVYQQHQVRLRPLTPLGINGSIWIWWTQILIEECADCCLERQKNKTDNYIVRKDEFPRMFH